MSRPSGRIPDGLGNFGTRDTQTQGYRCIDRPSGKILDGLGNIGTRDTYRHRWQTIRYRIPDGLGNSDVGVNVDRPSGKILDSLGNITLVPGDDVGRLSGKILDGLGNLGAWACTYVWTVRGRFVCNCLEPLSSLGCLGN